LEEDYLGDVGMTKSMCRRSEEFGKGKIQGRKSFLCLSVEDNLILN
jgi:hypothetical protein